MVWGIKTCVQVEIGPIFIGSLEKVSGGMFAIARPCCIKGGCCGWAEELLLVLELCFHLGQRGGGKQECQCHLARWSMVTGSRRICSLTKSSNT